MPQNRRRRCAAGASFERNAYQGYQTSFGVTAAPDQVSFRPSHSRLPWYHSDTRADYIADGRLIASKKLDSSAFSTLAPRHFVVGEKVQNCRRKISTSTCLSLRTTDF